MMIWMVTVRSNKTPLFSKDSFLKRDVLLILTVDDRKGSLERNWSFLQVQGGESKGGMFDKVR